MANLLKGRKASHKASYESFDLSHNIYFSSSVGHILPVHYDLLLPQDKVRIKSHMFSRTMELLSAAPVNMVEHIDYYFVPLQTIYSLFPSLLSDTNEDVTQSVFDRESFSDLFPTFYVDRFLNHTLPSQSNRTDTFFGFDIDKRGAYRLADMFNLSGYQTESDYTQDVQKLNILFPCAYQAVWQYFFRDDSRIDFDNTLFNLDSYYQAVNDGIQLSGDAVNSYFRLNYRPWKKDVFTIASPSPLGGSGSFNHFGFSKDSKQFTSFVEQWLTKIGGNAIIPEIVGSDGQNPNNQNNYSDVGFSNRSQSYAIQQSLQQHRIAEAIEKLSSIWMQSGKNYKDMMSNLFGSKVQEQVTRPIYIGSDSAPFNVNEEVAQMTTGTGSIQDDTFESYTDAGQITGKGIASNNPKDYTEFTAPCHGIFIALFSVVPDAVYSGNMTDFVHTYYNRASFPNPVTDELGERPLYGFELNNISINNNPLIKGWVPRFNELKLKPSTAHGAFKTSLKYWIPSHTLDLSFENSNYFAPFYIRPDYINSILLTPYDVSPSGISSTPQTYYDTDPFLHFFRIECYKASKMSSFGVPSTYFG